MLTESLLVAIIAFILYGASFIIRDKLYHRRLPPGPFPLPFIGSIYRLNTKIKPWQFFKNLADEYGEVFTFYFGHTRFVHIHGSKNIRDAMVTEANHFSCRGDNFVPGYENNYPKGIIQLDGQAWATNRKFGLTGLRMFGVGKTLMLYKIQEEAHHLIKILEQSCLEKVENDVATIIQNNVFNVVCCLIFGKRFELDDPTFLAIRNSSRDFFERPFQENALHFMFPFITKFSLPPQVKDFINANNVLSRAITEVIDKRKKLPHGQEVNDFIGLYLNKQHQITLESFVAICRDMFLAGTETTSSLLTWAIIYLCKWPEIQKKCQEVIDHVITSDRMPTLEDREHLAYIDAIMNELQRHVTIVPDSINHAIKGSGIEFKGYRIPANTVVPYGIWALHHDPEYWGDPEEFRPERWLDAEGNLADHSSHYMPYGIGPRICLAEGLAKVEYYVFIVAILQRFTFKFPKDYDVELDSGGVSFTNVPPSFDCIISRRIPSS